MQGSAEPRLVRYGTHVAGELADFGSVLKLWSLTEIDAVTFTVLQILLILHLQEHTDGHSRCLPSFRTSLILAMTSSSTSQGLKPLNHIRTLLTERKQCKNLLGELFREKLKAGT